MKMYILPLSLFISLFGSTIYAAGKLDKSIASFAKQIKNLDKKDHEFVVEFIKQAEDALSQAPDENKAFVTDAIQNTWKSAIEHSHSQLDLVVQKITLNDKADELKMAQKKLAKTLSPKSQIYTLSAQITSHLTQAAEKEVKDHAQSTKKIKDHGGLSTITNQQKSRIALLKEIILTGIDQEDPADFYKKLSEKITPPKDPKK